MKKETDTLKCTYEYTNGTTCNRPLTRSYKDKEGKQYCIFHARNDEKLQVLNKQMEIEISKATISFKKDIKIQNLSKDNENHKDKISKLRHKYHLSYEGAYFPDRFYYFMSFILEVDISFRGAMFNGLAQFDEVTFGGKVNFDSTIFSGEVSFLNTTFSGKAIFSVATFRQEADFQWAIFRGMVDFDGVFFCGKSLFMWATFYMEADFYYATFGGESDFRWVTFSGEASFWEATFRGEAEFKDVLFIGDVSFSRCRLKKGKIKFIETTFFSTGSFHDISEGSKITFINCRFSGVSFLRSHIGDSVFSNCCFYLTSGWINMEIQKINDEALSNDIQDYYLKRLKQRSRLLKDEKEKIDKLKGRNKRLLRKNLLSEHRYFLEQPHFRLLMRRLTKQGLNIASSPLLRLFPHKFDSIRKKLTSPNEASSLIDFGEVRDNYMQLKVNMDRMKDYDLANDFYYGEMEMKRLGEKWYKPKRWFLSLYNTLSKFGNAPVRAVIMFFVLIFIFSFPLFFMKLGIKDLSSQNKNQASYKVVSLEPNFLKNLGEMASLSLYNMTALSNLTRSPYEPLDKWTFYYVSVVQYFIRPIQLALIILAIRRKVKRGEE